MNNIISAWQINVEDYPVNGSFEEKIKFFIGYAILAPSGHNTQPWLFKITKNGIKLFADRTRALPVIDPDDRQLTISCGAALANFTIAANYFGFSARINICPYDEKYDLLAEVILAENFVLTDEIRKLFESITKRRTNRKPFENKTIDGQILQKFETIAGEDKIRLNIIKENRLRELAVNIIEEGDRIQSHDKSFCRELAKWVHPVRKKSKDGIPIYSFGVGDLFSQTGPFYLSNIDWGNIQAARDRNLIEGSPVLGIIESRTDTPEDWMNAGMALEKILLFATSENLSASYLNQPLEIPLLKEKLVNTLKLKGFPQQILRMGYGKDIKPTPRRNVDEVIK
ncbi:MAG: hypothetical protein JW917_04375 [Ignavibacteria bacterium]|nr:hypothetical protein [Ignavibacteria bacterium]